MHLCECNGTLGRDLKFWSVLLSKYNSCGGLQMTSGVSKAFAFLNKLLTRKSRAFGETPFCVHVTLKLNDIR